MVNQHFDTDVFVIGGGPAGLAAAIASAQKGLRVVLADCAKPPIDKTCGEGLMPDAVSALERLGVTLNSDHGHRLAGIRFIDGETRVEAAFPSGFGCGIRRTALHSLLVQRASEAGVSMLWGSHVEAASAGGVVVNGSVVRSRWIVGADGLKSRVRAWAGLDKPQPSSEQIRFGFRSHFAMEPWTDHVEVHWADGCQAFITPLGFAEICVAIMSRNSELRLEQALALFPEIQARLNGLQPITTERGAISLHRKFESVCGDSFALVGDASGSVDAVAGEGLRLAFQQGLSLADALERSDVSLYQAAHRRIARLPMVMSRLLLLMDDRRFLRHGVLRAFAAQPWIFSMLLATHVGGFSPGFDLEKALKPDWKLRPSTNDLQTAEVPEISL